MPTIEIKIAATPLACVTPFVPLPKLLLLSQQLLVPAAADLGQAAVGNDICALST